MNTDNLRIEHFPGKAGHHIDCIRTADTTGEHAKATRVRRMRVRPDHHATGERVLFEHDLMDDARAWTPETDAVSRGAAAQKIVDLGIRRARRVHVGVGAFMSLDQVIAMNRRGNRCLVAASLHELE